MSKTRYFFYSETQKRKRKMFAETSKPIYVQLEDGTVTEFTEQRDRPMPYGNWDDVIHLGIGKMVGHSPVVKEEKKERNPMNMDIDSVIEFKEEEKVKNYTWDALKPGEGVMDIAQDCVRLKPTFGEHWIAIYNNNAPGIDLYTKSMNAKGIKVRLKALHTTVEKV